MKQKKETVISFTTVGMRVRIIFVPGSVKNLEIGATGLVESKPELVAGRYQVKVRLDDGRLITVWEEYLEVVVESAPKAVGSAAPKAIAPEASNRAAIDNETSSSTSPQAVSTQAIPALPETASDNVASVPVEIVYSGESNLSPLFPEIIIDPEFQSLIPLPKQAEYHQLEQNLLQYGCRDSLVVWKRIRVDGTIERILLDGHNRRSLCTKHDIPYQIVELEMPSREAALAWIINNQLGRRNLFPEQVSYLRGKRYNLEKKQGERKDLTCDQSDHKSRTAEKLAEECQVGSGTIRRDGTYAQNLDTIGNAAGDSTKQKILSRQIRISKRDIKKLAGLVESNPGKLKQAFNRGKTGKQIVELAIKKAAPQHDESFPYAVGDVCWISSKDEEIRAFNGYWGIVVKIYDNRNYCDFLFYQGVRTGMRGDNLKPYEVDPNERKLAEQIVNRMANLMDCEPESVVVDVIQGISRRNVGELTELEQEYLSLAEKRHGIQRQPRTQIIMRRELSD